MLHHIISRRVACGMVYFIGASSDGLRISPERAANLISVTFYAAATSSLQKNHIVEDNLIRVREERSPPHSAERRNTAWQQASAPAFDATVVHNDELRAHEDAHRLHAIRSRE